MTLQDLLDQHGIRFFGAHELHGRETRGGPFVIVPPVDLWPNIIPTLELADEIREKMGSPLHVWSGYRSPEYNTLVGGSPTSEHMEFRALDLHSPTDYERLKAIAAEVMDHAAARGLRTGLGTYDDSRFLHIDTGAEKARYRRWKG